MAYVPCVSNDGWYCNVIEKEYFSSDAAYEIGRLSQNMLKVILNLKGSDLFIGQHINRLEK